LNKAFLIVFISVLFVLSCEDEKDTNPYEDVIPPQVTITSPQDSSTVTEIVTINCISTDNEGVEKVELWVNGDSTNVTDDTEPYSLDWNTTTYEPYTTIYEDGSFSITVRSYDENGNMTDSDPIILLVNNTIQFVKTFGGIVDDYGESVQQTTDGGYIITGTTKSFGYGGADIWLIKTDSERNEEWNQTFGGSDNEYGKSVQQTTDGGFIIVGTWLIKTDFDGNEEWINESIMGRSVKQTNDGGFIIIGETIDTFKKSGKDVYLIKTDSQGIKEWDQAFSSSGIYSDSGYSVQQTVDGGYIITGYTVGALTVDAVWVWLIKTDSRGEEEWNNTFLLNDGINEGRSVQQTTDGGYIITGNSSSSAGIILVKTDSVGDREWKSTFGYNSMDWGHSVRQTTDGGYIIAGSYEHTNDNTDAVIIKTQFRDFEEWTITIDGGNDEWCSSIQQTFDGGYIVTGGTSSYGNGESDVLLIKIDSEGNTVLFGD